MKGFEFDEDVVEWESRKEEELTRMKRSYGSLKGRRRSAEERKSILDEEDYREERTVRKNMKPHSSALKDAIDMYIAGYLYPIDVSILFKLVTLMQIAGKQKVDLTVQGFIDESWKGRSKLRGIIASRETIRASIKRLKQDGLINVETGRGGKASTYSLNHERLADVLQRKGCPENYVVKHLRQWGFPNIQMISARQDETEKAHKAEYRAKIRTISG